ncbi:hypothetical protein EVAR_84139_1 [Eumeta japonica]|uniref:(+)RNA virus helicase C-terminal domain-containing protein n=1 Tax=Eumeta variegata TaxID=151549 RepID=A0A4C2A888_EUMVA|nr:hypothetical protein EVAR_84139_1 [Eumeta japonica]
MRKTSKENDQDYSETFTDWETPKITWINGVPGCGKTTWIVQEFDNKRDCIVTATIEAAEDLKRKLANRIGAEATTRVRTKCPIFGRERAETEAGTGVVVARHGFPALLDDETNRKIFLEFCERVTRSTLAPYEKHFVISPAKPYERLCESERENLRKVYRHVANMRQERMNRKKKKKPNLILTQRKNPGKLETTWPRGS